jgi:hypothetical protein
VAAPYDFVNWFFKREVNMLSIVVGIFLLLHGGVHLLYFGHSARYFELEKGLVWPAGSWALSSFVEEGALRSVANTLLIVATMVFIVAGVSVFIKGDWWQTTVTVAAVFSTLVYLLLWDGSWQNLDGKGLVGILINVAILVLVHVFHWPSI